MSDSAPRSVNSVPIRLTAERWTHIARRHPEVEHYHDRIIETLTNPDFVAKGLHGELKAARLYADLAIGPGYVIVVYKETSSDDGFIITARISSNIANVIRGGIVWQKK